MRNVVLILTGVILLGCGGAVTNGADIPAEAKAEPAPDKTAPTPPEAPPAVPSRDPKILALAASAAACTYEEGSFDAECPAYRAWSDEEALFEGGKGDDTVFSLSGDPDEKLRVLASEKPLDDSRAYFKDKGRARLLYAMAQRETLPWLETRLGEWVVRTDAEALGLVAEYRELAKKSSVAMRKSIATSIGYHQTPLVLEVTRALLADPDASVQASAISALSFGGITPPSEPVCTLLTEQIARNDNLVGEALWAGSSSQCPGMHDLVIAELTKRVGDPTRITNALGIRLSLAAGGVCSRTSSEELKKKGFEVALKLTNAKVPDVNTRTAGLSALASCDKNAARNALTSLTKDKDKRVADDAKKALDALR